MALHFSGREPLNTAQRVPGHQHLRRLLLCCPTGNALARGGHLASGNSRACTTDAVHSRRNAGGLARFGRDLQHAEGERSRTCVTNAGFCGSAEDRSRLLHRVFARSGEEAEEDHQLRHRFGAESSRRPPRDTSQHVLHFVIKCLVECEPRGVLIS